MAALRDRVAFAVAAQQLKEGNMSHVRVFQARVTSMSQLYCSHSLNSKHEVLVCLSLTRALSNNTLRVQQRQGWLRKLALRNFRGQGVGQHGRIA